MPGIGPFLQLLAEFLCQFRQLLGNLNFQPLCILDLRHRPLYQRFQNQGIGLDGMFHHLAGDFQRQVGKCFFISYKILPLLLGQLVEQPFGGSQQIFNPLAFFLHSGLVCFLPGLPADLLRFGSGLLQDALPLFPGMPENFAGGFLRLGLHLFQPAAEQFFRCTAGLFRIGLGCCLGFRSLCSLFRVSRNLHRHRQNLIRDLHFTGGDQIPGADHLRQGSRPPLPWR